MPLNRRKFHLEPLEERQLLAVDSGLGGLSGMSDTSSSMLVSFPQSRSYYETVHVACLATSTVVHSDEDALIPRNMDPDWVLEKIQLYSRERVLADPVLAAKFGLDAALSEENVKTQLPSANREHAKITPLVFGQNLSDSDFEEDEFMQTRLARVVAQGKAVVDRVATVAGFLLSI